GATTKEKNISVDVDADASSQLLSLLKSSTAPSDLATPQPSTFPQPPVESHSS
uniref:MRNA DECAPPING COMPLEX SUBUNIT 2 n=1 Tax=Schizosaccharomyces pombe TaxID=4896 RepID=UPI00024BBD17|nr:Chain B, MRNA DECAPPING COMPLEX SUBUNIT 2 [Schizosaccharomyces pombe]